MNRFAYASATTITEAATAATATVAHAMTASPETMGRDEVSVIKAGGIDLLDLLKEGLLQPGTVVNLREIPGLDSVTEEPDGSLRIGSMATLASLATHPMLRERFAALAGAVADSASPQIRNVATLGGNLLQRPRCWYLRSHAYRCLRKGGGHCFAIHGENQYHAIFNNMPCAIVHPSTAATALVALGASIEITGPSGAARDVLLEDFLVPVECDMQRENNLGPREILTAIILPRPAPGTRMVHIKQGEKDSFDWPLADVAVVLKHDSSGTCSRATVVLGAAAPVPHRAKKAEAALTGKRIDEGTAAQAAHAALDGATPLSKNAYKLPLFEALVRRAILKAAEP
ncbi:MAG TPA: FAD binding domain-containing protein [Bradyrhizobium sp.]|nr:FAD binding domain-containing protein [Bradyrhizobium sp.]